jgi:hypothetical protein
MRHFLFLLLLFFVALGTGHSQTEKVNIDDYKPVIFGILKTKAEYDLDNSKLRFEVRNARFWGQRKNKSLFFVQS